MRIVKTCIGTLALALALTAQGVLAQAPSGVIESRQYEGVGESVFEAVGSYFMERFRNKEGGLFTIKLEPSPFAAETSGKIAGRGQTSATIMQSGFEDTTFPATYAISGSLKGTLTRATASSSASASGIAPIDGVNRKVTMSVKGNGILDPASQTFVATKSGKAAATGAGSINIAERAVTSAIANTDAFYFRGWRLAGSLQSSANKVTGTATVYLDSGRAFACSVNGTFSAKKQTTKLNVVGTGASKGIKLTAFLTGNQITRIAGTLLGQKVDVDG